jgi:hypothetical protein
MAEEGAVVHENPQLGASSVSTGVLSKRLLLWCCLTTKDGR